MRGFTVYEGNYATGMFVRNKKVHSARFVSKSTNYYFLIVLITGWHLRPIFRLILTGYIYSRYMYDGIGHFYNAQSYESLYELCTAYRFKDIKTLTNKSAKSTFELIHLIKTLLFSRFDLQTTRKLRNFSFGTPLFKGQLRSGGTKFGPLLKGHLYSGER